MDGRGMMVIVMVAGGAVVSGCAPRAAFDAPDPATRLGALEQAVAADDRSAIPEIIGLLDSDDPAVRLFAILALERMTGETLGYDYAAPERERREAADRWQAWYEGRGGRGGAWGPAGGDGPADRYASSTR